MFDVGVVGINQKSGSLYLREKLTLICQRCFGTNHLPHENLSYSLLSTCNRVELYFSANDLPLAHSYIIHTLQKECEEEFEPNLYSFFGLDCFTHLARVTSGLDSTILGETEIQGQVKQAYEDANAQGLLNRELHFLFQKCLKLGKEARGKMTVTRGMLSWEGAIIEAAQGLFENPKQLNILFVGASEINHKIMESFNNKGFENLYLCNRTRESAVGMAEEQKVELLDWEKRLDPMFDLMIFGTKSPDYLATRETVSHLSGKNRLLVDLSVPRNVEPEIGFHPWIYVLNIDQIHLVVEKYRRIKSDEVSDIEGSISDSAKRQIELYNKKRLAGVA